MGLRLYIGAPRCGKSTLLRRHAYHSRQPGLVFLIVDRDGRGTWDGPRFNSIDEFRKRETLPRFAVFPPRLARAVAALAIELGDCVYVDEEAHRVVAEGYRGPKGEVGSPGYVPPHPLWSIAHEGSHLENGRGESCEVLALLATHRPANLPADLVACADGVYLGHTTLWNDVERCYREGWVENARSPRDAQRILSSLPVGQFLTIELR